MRLTAFRFGQLRRSPPSVGYLNDTLLPCIPQLPAFVRRFASPSSSSPSSSSTRVAIFGGGSLGILHAGLMQLRFSHEQNQRSVPDSGSIFPSSAPILSSSVRVISSQPELVEILQRDGCTFELTSDFVQKHRTWIIGEHQSRQNGGIIQGEASSTRVSLPHKVQIPASLSLNPTLPALLPPTHILIMVKDGKALDRAIREIYELIRLLMLDNDRQLLDESSFPIICLLMNGLGHRERALECIAVQL